MFLVVRKVMVIISEKKGNLLVLADRPLKKYSAEQQIYFIENKSYIK